MIKLNYLEYLFIYILFTEFLIKDSIFTNLFFTDFYLHIL